MTQQDTRALFLTTRNDQAAVHYNHGVVLMLSAWPGAAELLDAALARDPEFALAHAARGRLHAICAQPTLARQAFAEAERLAARFGDERERSHIHVLSTALKGASDHAISTGVAHLDLWPNDAVIFSLLLGPFGLLAFSGMANHDQARVDLCKRYEGAYASNDWWFLTYSGWAIAENGEATQGRSILERAVTLRPENANGVHALTHAMYEQGATIEADSLLAGWLPGYAREGILHGHLAWHRALNALEQGDADGALRIYTAQIQPDVSLGMPINIVSDSASLLWRMSAYGHRLPEGLWEQISDYTRSRYPSAGHAFIDSHMLMIAAATGDLEALEARLSGLEALLDKGAPGAGAVVPAIGRALAAFAKGNYAACASLLEPVAHEVVRIGGSGAQREVFEDTLLVAYMRSGEADKARQLLDTRLHRRPSPRDGRWRQTLASGPNDPVV
ncbi:tetratricopeptide repeat protein, partial [Asticcacaulis sp. W401b]|uniref:tetratricopeptide repeat protein n=1 Tax=Asticcacaulis sp. W401b TaxID=3388666 RepID=UPI003970F297